MGGSSTSPVFLDWLDSVAVIIASGVAIWGINAWRREHVGKRRIDLAEETLALFYEARDVINAARSVLGFDTEYREAEKIQREASGNESGPQEVLIVTYRLYRRNDLFARIRTLRYRFAAAFGNRAATPFYELVRLKSEVIVAERRLAELRRERRSTGEAAARLAQVSQLSDVVELGGVDSDPTTQRLNRIVERIEHVCGPVIQSYGRTLAGALLMRGRGVLGILQSQAWFARLRRLLGRTQYRASRSRDVAPPPDLSAP